MICEIYRIIYFPKIEIYISDETVSFVDISFGTCVKYTIMNTALDIDMIWI